jgi:hypothetical protein
MTVTGFVIDATAITSESISSPLQTARLLDAVRFTEVPVVSVNVVARVVFCGSAALGQPTIGVASAIHAVRFETPVALTVIGSAGSPGATDGRVNVVWQNASVANASKRVMVFIVVFLFVFL